jgi:hypothetical protein
VRNLSELEPQAAAEVVRAGKPETCISYSVLEDGRVALRKQGGRVALTLVAFLAACAEPGLPEASGPSNSSTQSVAEPEPMLDDPSDASTFHAVEPTLSLKAPESRPPRDHWPTATDVARDLPQHSALPPVRPLAGKPVPHPEPAPTPRPEPVRGELLRRPTPEPAPPTPHPVAGGLRAPGR